MAVTSNGVQFGWRTVQPSELADQVAHGVKVTCPCGQHFRVDLARLLRGQSAELVPVEPDDVTGVSYKRRRAED